ncbi:hemin-degrading factor [Elioraea sp.]|uniref:hemin-degrading factor n=1 Tax=Elioraea sp. TaxID=2185103 RepID=UPI0021DC25F2|nr:ChuX/HutX family heme-like substrate-binding protein [Elioraea sp.]GIX09253.1 MAG: hemin-degrading factor [Elioraea sp.]
MTETLPVTAVAERFAGLIAERPSLRVRDAADALGVPEAAIVAGLAGARRLRPDWRALLEAVAGAGEVMALTRNAHCVHEKHGTYPRPETHGRVGLVLGQEIDLRLFLDHWAHAWFVPEGNPGSPRGSIQVFDRAGVAVHKIFATPATPPGALASIAERLAVADRTMPDFTDPEPPRPERADAAIDRARLRSDWLALQDTHDFVRLLRRHKAGRAQAFRLAGEDLARRIDVLAPVAALRGAAAETLPIMVFVPNPGCIQIHSGPVQRVEQRGPWFNVLDSRFNLHLRTDRLAHAWLVRKPTADGVVTSIEAFDAADRLVLMLFGSRKPGMPESEAWRALAARVAEGAPC